MIEPNFDLMLWIIFIGFCIRPIAQIILGIYEKEKETHYDKGDVLIGVFNLILVILVILL